VLRVLALVATIGLGDSLNPSTIGPALYVASGERSRSAVVEFTLAVFAVHFLGGAALVLGPGQLLLSLLKDVDHTTRDALEAGAGVVMVLVAGLLWRKRQRMAHKDLPTPSPERKSTLLLGATIIAVELPTAFPYFAAIAAIVAYGGGVGRQGFLLAAYNLCFVAPLVAILATLVLAGEHADELLARAREAVARRWPVAIAALLSLAGIALVAAGAVELATK